MVDTKEVEQRLQELRSKSEESTRAKLEREKQLAAVKIKKEDIAVDFGDLVKLEGGDS